MLPVHSFEPEREASVIRVEVRPELLRWARERASIDPGTLARRFPHLEAWERGEEQPTLKQLEAFAQATHTAVGYLFLPAPPVETLPIPDFRTVANQEIGRPGPDLLDTVYLCQQRQEWYRDYTLSVGDQPLPYVRSVRVGDDVARTATLIRDTIGFDLEERRRLPGWSDALRRFIELVDASGVLVMVSGVVGSNNRRKLDPQEFRGFALADDVAPLVFINGADTKAAQMFTLAHELAHIWLGQSAVTDAQAAFLPGNRVERWCNEVAAELLVPLVVLRAELRPDADLRTETDRLARAFKVSTLVILRRMHDAGRLTRAQLREEYDAELERLLDIQRDGGGGDFYRTLGARVSRRFARAIVVSTLEGRSSFTDAFRLLGVKKIQTFRSIGHHVGVEF